MGASERVQLNRRMYRGRPCATSLVPSRGDRRLTLIQPFRALRPAPGRAAEVLAPPYDVLSSAEARVRAEGKPWSFLHVSKPEIDLDPGIDPHDAAVYAKAAENLGRMVAAGVLVRDDAPSYYVYRLTRLGRSQTGLAAVASLADYRDQPHSQARADDAGEGGRSRPPDRGGQRPDRAGDDRLSRGAEDRRACSPTPPKARPRSTSPGRTASATSSGRSAIRLRSTRSPAPSTPYPPSTSPTDITVRRRHRASPRRMATAPRRSATSSPCSFPSTR